MGPGRTVRPPRNAPQSQGQHSGSTSASKSRKVRGINKGKGLERLIKRAGHPLNLTISEERRPIGENNELLSREIGLLTRYHAPIQRAGWHSLTEDDKEPLYELLKLKFNLDFTQDHIKGCVDLLFSSSYKSFRHKCYEHYVKSGDDARSNPYPPLIDNRVGDWIWLCDHFETEEFKKRSTIGKANRSNLPYVHKKGTKSFVAVQHELNCGDIRLYKECYSSDKKGWASEDARNKHEEMLQKQKEPIEEGEVPLTEQQICEHVLGKAYGYVRGRGHGPKPNRRAYSSASSSTQHVVEELASTKEIVATQQTQIEAQQSQLEAQQKKIDWLQSVVSNLVGISPPMDGTSATGLGFTTERPMPSDGIGSLISNTVERMSSFPRSFASHLRPGYRPAPTSSSDGNGSLVSDGGSRR
ncbi:hypothetical protein VPH35_022479 [Triticum aestivum]|uniref:Transposase, Ptta/En/Spm, plant n=1 Tax=Triticum turgidum subsp. durum TaxID=4567 RepID=A0A9R1P0E9_TRITD|nr:uncharacterized protein LOC123189857 isoform X2 [Triticum aestivum]VAH34441.1 unnamed protein product [Triticum turgidum subsp. durum]